MATLIPSGGSTYITLSPGSWVTFKGAGTVSFVPPSPIRAAMVQDINLAGVTVGPFPVLAKLFVNATADTIYEGSSVAKAAVQPYLQSGPIAAGVGNSYTQAGAVGVQGTNFFTPRCQLNGINAALGRVWSRIHLYGQDGDTSRGILSRYKSQVRAGRPYNDVIVWGFLTNDQPNGLQYETLGNAASLINEVTVVDGARLFWFIEPINDPMQASPLRKQLYADYVRFLTKMAQSTPGMYLVNLNKYANNKDPAVTMQTRGYMLSGGDVGTHCSAKFTFGPALAAARETLPLILPQCPLPVLQNEDPYCITVNPLMIGANGTSGPTSAGSNFIWKQAGIDSAGTTVLPHMTGAGLTGGSTATAAKAAHPQSVTWSAGETTEAPVKFHIQTGAGQGGVFTFFLRDLTVRTHAQYVTIGSGTPTVSAAYNIVRPTTYNGCLYYPISGFGAMSTVDPTDTWTTQLGATFTDNGVTFLVKKDWTQGRVIVNGIADLFFDTTTFVGKCTLPQVDLGIYNNVNNGSQTINGSQGANTGLGTTPAIPSANIYGADGALTPGNLPSQLRLHTQYDPNAPVSNLPGVTNGLPDGARMKFQIAVDENTTLDFWVAGMYGYVLQGVDPAPAHVVIA